MHKKIKNGLDIFFTSKKLSTVLILAIELKFVIILYIRKEIIKQLKIFKINNTDNRLFIL